jgi:hypothetical protein
MSDLWLWVILAGLANYKAAHMISQDGDDGPFDVFKTLRNKVGTSNWVGKGFHCFSCTSFWGGLVAAVLLNTGLPWNLFILVWAAISSLSYFLWRYFG